MRQKEILVLIVTVAIILRFTYSVFIPSGQNPDEIYFFERTWSEATREISFEGKNYPNNEYFYPPLYFFISSFLVRFILIFIDNPNSLREAFFTFGQFFRFISFVLSIIQIYLIWLIIKKISIPNEVKLSVFAFAVLLPSYIVFGSYLNPNSILLLLVLLFISVLFDPKIKDLRKSLVLGIISGLALLTKFEGIILPFTAVFYMSFSKKITPVIKNAFIMILISFVIGGWWYLKNFFDTGWFYDRELFLASISQNIRPFSFPNYLGMLTDWTFQTFFVSYGVTNNIRLGPQAYWVLFSLVIMAFLGLLRMGFKGLAKNSTLRAMFASLGVLFFFNTLIFVHLNFNFAFQPQGRYLFPSLLFIVLILVSGISFWLRTRLSLLPKLVLFFLLFLNIWGMNCTAKFYYGVDFLPNVLTCTYYR